MVDDQMSATQQAIKSITEINKNWLDTVMGLNSKVDALTHKHDAMIMLMQRAEQKENSDEVGEDGRKPSGATHRLHIATLERAKIRRDIIDLYVQGQTDKREMLEYVKLYAPLTTRFWNWFADWWNGNRK